MADTSYQLEDQAGQISITVRTNKPVAFDSPDHTTPWGTAHDNSVNQAFNNKLLWWLPKTDVRLMDIGCSGGGFVRSMLDDGCIAVGIEGSDYSKKAGRAEWPVIPQFLFTADATVPFDVMLTEPNGEEQRLMFTVITAWEFIEHIATENLPGVMANIDRHLGKNGVVIMSVSPNEDIIDGVQLHQTIQPKEWWIEKMASLGFTHHPEALAYFGNDYIRWEANAANSFHLIMTRTTEDLPFSERLVASRFEYAMKPPGLHFTQQFLETKAFEEEPLCVIDLGAAGGFEEHWNNFESQIRLIGFEPNASECARLNAQTANSAFGRSERFYPYAIGGKQETRTLYCTLNSVASSCLQPNEAILARFPQGDVGQIVDKQQLTTISLDQFMSENGISHVDFLKLDIEGLELEALRGARNLLENSLLGLSVEIFFQPYRQGQPSYGEIESLLKAYGFTLFDMNFERWQRRTLATHDWETWYNKGQIMWGQAIFLRDIVSLPKHCSFKPTLVKARKLAALAEVLGFADFSHEVLETAERLNNH